MTSDKVVVADDTEGVQIIDDWISATQAAVIIMRNPDIVRKLAAVGHIRVHQPPGCRATFSRRDCEKLAPPRHADRSVRPGFIADAGLKRKLRACSPRRGGHG